MRLLLLPFILFVIYFIGQLEGKCVVPPIHSATTVDPTPGRKKCMTNYWVNRVIVTDAKPIFDGTAPQEIDCLSKCSIDDNCMLFFFTNATKQCQTYPVGNFNITFIPGYEEGFNNPNPIRAELNVVGVAYPPCTDEAFTELINYQPITLKNGKKFKWVYDHLLAPIVLQPVN